MDTAENTLVFPELSYQVVGAAFDVFNELGWGYKEKVYEQALLLELQKFRLPIRSQVYIPLQYKENIIGKFFADIIVDDKILIELKIVSQLGYVHIKQIYPYLKAARFKLGILIYFTKDGVKYRRILNPEV